MSLPIWSSTETIAPASFRLLPLAVVFLSSFPEIRCWESAPPLVTSRERRARLVGVDELRHHVAVIGQSATWVSPDLLTQKYLDLRPLRLTAAAKWRQICDLFLCICFSRRVASDLRESTH